MVCKVLLVLSLVAWITHAEDCRTPLGASSTCIPLFQCSSLASAFSKKPLARETIEFLRSSQCGFQGSVPKVCCGPLPANTGVAPVQPSRKPTISDDGSSDSELPSRSQCGNDIEADKIFGGELTELDEFPWMALLGYRNRRYTNKKTSYSCGGVLINHRYVLTAAHCLTGAILTEIGPIISVRLGEYDTAQTNDCYGALCSEPVQEIAVSSSHPHPGYVENSASREDDIGLVRMEKRARFSEFVQPICLVKPNARIAADRDLFVAGWGKTEKGTSSTVKLKLIVPYFNKNECVSKYQSLKVQLTQKQLCAGGEYNKDSCRGDSGGPLMMTGDDKKWDVVGVVSFGYGCGRDGWPGVYTSVASYIGWIQSTMRSAEN